MRAFEIRQQVNPLLFHKLIDWLDKRGKTEKTKYIKCDFQEIVKLLGVSARHARKVVECARNKGFIQTERHGNDYYIYRMKYLERLMGFKRTVWDLYLKHKCKVRDNAPELYKKMVNYIKKIVGKKRKATTF